MRKKFKIQKVLVAMSGGVDSSVTAALLKEADGFDVIGVFMKLWSENDFKKAESRARKIAKALKIPFYSLDFKKEFKKKIIDCFLNAYQKGITPNPCVVCNKEVKFGLLLKKARQLGARFIATGHYARIKEGKDGIRLIKAKDKQKDQSYFLWKLNQKQLNHALFPVGGYTKNEVRKMSKKFKLKISGVSESQDVCFVKPTTNDFLKRYLKTKPGKIVNTEGKIIGEHQGLWFYTIGQRKGINLSGGPFYVTDKDLKKNLLIVSKNKKDLYKREIIVKNVNWISGKAPKLPIKVKIKIRYRHKAANATINKIENKKYKLQFKTAQKAVTPGQSAVFYEKNQILGGATIY